jgi:hypothetical protein
MVADNVDVKTAMTRFGHSDVRLTIELYAQATTEADHRAAEGWPHDLDRDPVRDSGIDALSRGAATVRRS